MNSHSITRNLLTLALLTIFACLFLGQPVQGALVIYEGFDYTSVGNALEGKGGTTEVGLTGTWSEPAGGDDMYLKAGSLNFSNLTTSGNHIGYSSNSGSDRYNRSLTTTGFTQPAIYFSFLFEKLQNNYGADREGFALMNGVLPEARWDSGNAGAVGRHGFAVAAVNNSNLKAVAYDGTTGTRVDGTSTLPITVVNGASNTSTSNVAVNLIVGEVSFNTGTGGKDVFKLYNAADDGSLDATDLTLIDTIEADVDESLLSTLNLTRQVNVNYDEIRIGTTLADITPVPPVLTWDGGSGTWTDANWNSSGGWQTEAVVTFNKPGDQTITLDGDITAASLDFSAGGAYTITDNSGDGTPDSLTVTGDTTVASGVTVSFASGTVNTADVAVNGTLILDGSSLTGGAITVGAGAVFGGSGTVDATSVILDDTAKFWVDPNGPLAFGTTAVTVGSLQLGDLMFASLDPGTYVLMTGDNLDLSGILTGIANIGTLNNGRDAYFQLGSLELVVIPEPSTIILAGLGLMGICFRRRRK